MPAARIDASAPDPVAGRVEVFRMLSGQHGLGLAIACLLLQVSLHGGAPVMPHKSGRAETELVAALLQPPADIDIIPRPAEHRVKAAHLVQHPPVESHVATGQML